jgi:hypothetical protein
MEDLWPNFDKTEQVENNSIEILRTQARALDKKTNGKVKATFSKVQYNTKDYIDFREIGRGLFSGQTPEEELEVELRNKADANTLFSKTEYKFEIYNEVFRFRVFKVRYSKLYPISLAIDDGIARELSIETTQSVNDDLQLKKTLAKIFTSKKIVSIINSFILNEER